MITWENYKSGLETKISELTYFNNNLEYTLKSALKPLTEIESGKMRNNLVKGYGMLADWSKYIANEPELNRHEDYEQYYNQSPQLTEKHVVQQKRFCGMSIKAYKKLADKDKAKVDIKAKEYLKILS
ncbi:MAG: hypothetical protein V1839_02630 [archaeon]